MSRRPNEKFPLKTSQEKKYRSKFMEKALIFSKAESCPPRSRQGLLIRTDSNKSPKDEARLGIGIGLVRIIRFFLLSRILNKLS